MRRPVDPITTMIKPEMLTNWDAADAVFQAACDMVARLFHGTVDGEDLGAEHCALWALLYVFCERAIRDGKNPGELIAEWFDVTDLPPISLAEEEMAQTDRHFPNRKEMWRKENMQEIMSG